jgi:hypothetical protein
LVEPDQPLAALSSWLGGRPDGPLRSGEHAFDPGGTMNTRPTPELDSLHRHQAWIEDNYKTIATIGYVAEDLRVHSRRIRGSIDDPHGRRVAELRHFAHRLRQVVDELDDLPAPVQRAA